MVCLIIYLVCSKFMDDAHQPLVGVVSCGLLLLQFLTLLHCLTLLQEHLISIYKQFFQHPSFFGNSISLKTQLTAKLQIQISYRLVDSTLPILKEEHEIKSPMLKSTTNPISNFSNILQSFVAGSQTSLQCL